MQRFLLLSFTFAFPLFAQLSSLEKGISFFNNRADNSVDLIADSYFIDSAIHQFKMALEEDSYRLDAGIYLLRCSYFKGKFVALTDTERKKYFNQGKILGEKLIEEYPKSAAIHYWYLVNLGSWSEIYGIVSAAREGVANIMRTLSKKIISLDHEYSNGGGYFLLGAVHLKSPYIPFILSWPDKEKAYKYLKLAYETGEATPSQIVYFARVLHSNSQQNEALSLLKNLLNAKVSKVNELEDREQYNISKELIDSWK